MFKGATSTMIKVNKDSDYSSSSEDECILPFDFELPECRLPKFLDTPSKWSSCVYATDTLSLWCDLQLKIESFSPVSLSEDEVDIVVRAMASDLVYVHGIIKFFPSEMCSDCGVVHSVSHAFIFFTAIVLYLDILSVILLKELKFEAFQVNLI